MSLEFVDHFACKFLSIRVASDLIRGAIVSRTQFFGKRVIADGVLVCGVLCCVGGDGLGGWVNMAHQMGDQVNPLGAFVCIEMPMLACLLQPIPCSILCYRDTHTFIIHGTRGWARSTWCPLASTASGSVMGTLAFVVTG